MSTAAVALNTANPTKPTRLVLTNTSANAADLGTSAVTAGAGYSLAASATTTVDIEPGDVMYAIRSGGTDAVISVLRV